LDVWEEFYWGFVLEGTIPYKYLDFCRRGVVVGGSRVYSYEECIVLVQF